MSRVNLNLSLTEEEKRKLDALIKASQPRSMSALVGHLISDEYSRRAPEINGSRRQAQESDR
jgi:hypothetical protein